MLTKQDITLLKGTFVTKEEHNRDFNYLVANMATKQDMAELRSEFLDLKEGFSKVMNSVDTLVGKFNDFYQEMAFSAVQYKRQVEWNHRVAKKIDVPFDY